MEKFKIDIKMKDFGVNTKELEGFGKALKRSLITSLSPELTFNHGQNAIKKLSKEQLKQEQKYKLVDKSIISAIINNSTIYQHQSKPESKQPKDFDESEQQQCPVSKHKP